MPQPTAPTTTLYNYYIYVTNRPKLNAVTPQLDTNTQPLASNTPTYDSLQINATHNKAVFDVKLDRPTAVSFQQFLQVTVTGRLRLKCDGTRAETRFCLSAKRTSPFKSAGASVQSTTGSRGVHISGSSGSNAGYTMFRGGVKSTGYPHHSPVSLSLPLPCVTVCHHVSTGLLTIYISSVDFARVAYVTVLLVW